MLGLIIHEDDVRPLVGDENWIGDILENQVEPVALGRRFHLGKAHALYLSFELIRRSPQVGDVAQYGQDSVVWSDAFAERMC